MTLFTSLYDLFAAVDEIEGKKKLQKIVHILQECSPADFRVTFGLGQFGAYSSELACDVTDIVKDGYLEATDSHTMTGHPTVKYSKNTSYDEAIASFGSPGNAEWKTLAQKLNEKKTRELEAISTIIFLLSRDTGPERLKTRFTSLKPHLESLYDDSLTEAKRLWALRAA